MLEVAKLRVHPGGAQLWLRRSIVKGLGVREEDGKDVPLLLELRPGGVLIVKRPSDTHDDIVIKEVQG